MMNTKHVLIAGAGAFLTLRTLVNPKMDRNQYQFAHANGDIKTTIVPKL